MLGLRRHTVRLAQHDPEWAEAFAAIAGDICLATGLPMERVQHIGSTAVTGLAAKPIIDVDVGLLDTEPVERIVSSLVGAGLLDRGEFGAGVRRLLVRESAPDPPRLRSNEPMKLSVVLAPVL